MKIRFKKTKRNNTLGNVNFLGRPMTQSRTHTSPIFGSFLNIPKPNFSRSLLKRPALKFYGDSDGDGIMNGLDCAPYNKRKQGPMHSGGGMAQNISISKSSATPEGKSGRQYHIMPIVTQPETKTQNVGGKLPYINPTDPTEKPLIGGIGNPAAVYAQQQGYGYQIVNDAQGNQSGQVTLPSGQQVDEWTLYRQDHQAKTIQPTVAAVTVSKSVQMAPVQVAPRQMTGSTNPTFRNITQAAAAETFASRINQVRPVQSTVQSQDFYGSAPAGYRRARR